MGLEFDMGDMSEETPVIQHYYIFIVYIFPHQHMQASDLRLLHIIQMLFTMYVGD